MTTVALQRFLQAPRRRFIVTTVTLGLGLLIVLPAADEYKASKDRNAETLASLQAAQNAVARIESQETLLSERQARLANLESRTVADADLPAYRDTLVSMARETGCQLRRLHSGGPMLRSWEPGDSIHEQSSGKKGDKGFELGSQQIQLSVTGSLENAKRMLEGLQAQNKLMQVKTFAVRPAGQDSGEVTLELEFVLYDLTAVKPEA